MKTPSIQSLLDWLDIKGLLDSRNQAEAAILCEMNSPTIPLHMSILMVLGSATSCSFIFLFLYSMKILSTENYSYLYTGVGSIILALLIYYFSRQSKILLQSFGNLTALILMLLGKVLFIFGAYLKLPLSWGVAEHHWSVTLSLTFITLLIYPIFPNKIDRFISTLATLITWSITLSIEFEHNIPLFLMYILTLISLFGFYNWNNRSKQWDPIVIACLSFLCFLALFLSYYTLADLSHSNSFWRIAPLYFNLSLGFFTTALCLLFSNSLHKLPDPPILIAIIGVLLLSIISNNGILFSVVLLILGYRKYQNLLIIFGWIFMITFMIRFYYSLPLSLEYKSFTLIGSGIILIMTNLVVKYLKWDQD